MAEFVAIVSSVTELSNYFNMLNWGKSLFKGIACTQQCLSTRLWGNIDGFLWVLIDMFHGR